MTKEKMKPIFPYIGIPLLSAILLVLHADRPDPFIIFRYELLIIFGYVAAVFDIKSKIIPNSLTLTMLAAWVIITVPMLITDIDAAAALLAGSALGFAVGGGLFLIAYFISRKGLGGGDVKFMAAAGLYLGYEGVLSSMLLGTILAAVFSLVLIVLKKINRKDTIPLAPFLLIGILITVFFAT